ncbi:MAG TPA: hypothetical protein PKE16_11235, partial [Hyphomicrobium sp.]|nr:hypothetical protein [Hyphomicrobium sp.]
LKDNKGLLAAVGKPTENPLPKLTFRSPGCTMWHSDIGAVVRDDIGAKDWQKFQSAADAKYGHSGGLKKNSLHVGASLAFAWESGKRSPNLDVTCRAIVDPDNKVPL